ncbi:hypothetical protein [Streptomyces brasiliensis]|uniref:NAD(P)-binding domain-containing protein n=1 Tax=Streptomyces brasiliensis TaxID=1954 RepID=A0A917UKV4_9ACTN|nr:hypothetical protein [Streptomyces brasiliensis]GGJ64664.1 hypothetical protein GCM10010121_089150 [Streptomyces brasiliensis]
MRILIIGGHGRVARVMVPRLIARGDEVITTVRHQEQFADVERLGAQPFGRPGRSIADTPGPAVGTAP